MHSQTSPLIAQPSEQSLTWFVWVYELSLRLTIFQVAGARDRTSDPWIARPALYPLTHGGLNQQSLFILFLVQNFINIDGMPCRNQREWFWKQTNISIKFWSGDNLNKLDWLTHQNLYCMCSISNVTCPGVRTISFEATLGFFKRTFCIHTTCITV